MRKLLAIIVLTASAFSLSAQITYRDNVNKDMIRHSFRSGKGARTELIIPQVNGFNVYKADLHTHTIFSDGSVTPELRVREAWLDGMDIMAVTEHLEYRPYEKKFVEYMEGYVKKGEEAINYNIMTTPADKKGVQVDLNYVVKLSQAAAADLGVLIIPGSEITRESKQIGHYNALFTTDNNVIYDPDPLQALRNAKAQGALIQHNHPGWTRKSLEMPEFEVKAYGEGLIDGIETMNGTEFYPKAIERAQELGLFVSSNTDVHATTAIDYPGEMGGRNMTLVFAKEKTLESVKDALVNRRTISYAYENFAGDEQLLKDLFLSCVSFEAVRVDYKNRQIFNITNHSSLPFAFRLGGSNLIWLDPLSTIQLKGGNLKLTLVNMWYGVDKHPVVEVKF